LEQDGARRVREAIEARGVSQIRAQARKNVALSCGPPEQSQGLALILSQQIKQLLRWIGINEEPFRAEDARFVHSMKTTTSDC
jgi:hypothetical protein